jgi:hypothetical protein
MRILRALWRLWLRRWPDILIALFACLVAAGLGLYLLLFWLLAWGLE